MGGVGGERGRGRETHRERKEREREREGHREKERERERERERDSVVVVVPLRRGVCSALAPKALHFYLIIIIALCKGARFYW